jgi:hypothetical protein
MWSRVLLSEESANPIRTCTQAPRDSGGWGFLERYLGLRSLSRLHQ